MKTRKIFFILTITILLLGVISCSKNEGCTDPAANNFDIEAEKDDGSCTYDEVKTEEHLETHLNFNFSHNFDGVPVTAANFNQFNFINANGDTMSISKLRYLISDIKLYTTSGDSIVFPGYQLIDLTDIMSLNYTPGALGLGSYAGIGFNFGFDTTDNAGNYIDLNSASWNWPAMIGGGYHNMQFEGRYKLNGADSSFAFHNGTASNMGNHEQNHISIRLGAVSFNQHNVSININMNIAEWFRNPNTWDLNTNHTNLMMNYTVQKMMQTNGYNVFSLGSVFQKQ